MIFQAADFLQGGSCFYIGTKKSAFFTKLPGNAGHFYNGKKKKTIRLLESLQNRVFYVAGDTLNEYSTEILQIDLFLDLWNRCCLAGLEIEQMLVKQKMIFSS